MQHELGVVLTCSTYLLKHCSGCITEIIERRSDRRHKAYRCVPYQALRSHPLNYTSINNAFTFWV